MLITKLKAKIHRCTVTETNLHYEGSCAIDESLLATVGILEYEMIHIYNVNTGDRFTTYAIGAPAGSGMISVRGSAARRAEVGDILIICTYGMCSSTSDDAYCLPSVVHVDSNNKDIQ